MAELILDVTDISDGLGNWLGSGTSPYVDAQDANYIYNETKKGSTNALKFENTAESGAITNVVISVRGNSASGGGDINPFSYSDDDGATWGGEISFTNFTVAYETRSTGDISAFYDTWAKINLAACMLEAGNSTERVQVDHIYMTIQYSSALSIDVGDAIGVSQAID